MKKSLGGHNKLARDCSVQIFRWSRWSGTWSSFFGKVRRNQGLAIYDHGYLTSPFYCKCPRDKSLLDYLLGYVQSLQKDFGYRLEGIIVANSSSVAHNLTYAATQTFYSAQHMLQKWCKICHSGAEHKECLVQYMVPLQLFRECMKRNYHMPSSVFLGLSFSDDYVSLAMSDGCYLTARFYNGYPRNDSLSDKLVDVVQMLNKDFEYDLEGIIVAYSSSTAPPEKICNLMESLCKKGQFASLNFKVYILGRQHCIRDSVIQQAYDKTFSAQDMLRAFLHSFNNLHKDKDWVEWEDFEREKQCKICHSGAEHKMVQYLEPLKLFRESMKRTYYMPPAVFLGLSISDKNVSLAVSDRHYSDACSYGLYPIDYKSFLDKLLDSVLRLKRDSENPSSLEINYHMDRLCKKGRFKSLKYTCWEDDIASRSALFECYGSGSKLFPKDCSSGSEWKTFPVDCSERQEYFERTSAKYMLEVFLNFFNTLHINKDLRKRRGWISRGKEAVQDAPLQSRAQDDQEHEANEEMEDSEEETEEMEDTDEEMAYPQSCAR